MDSFFIKSFLCLIGLVAVHLTAFHVHRINPFLQARLLSAAGGVSIAYIFIDLLPKFCSGAATVEHAFEGLFPYLERHVYIMGLLGLLFAYTVQRAAASPTTTLSQMKRKFWGQVTAYAIFNAMIGYSLANKNDPDIQPIILFTIAVGLHYYINDYNLRESNPELYESEARYVIALGLIAGWVVGLFWQIPEAALAIILSFLSGGIMMNVFRHEIPADNPNNYTSFVFGAVTYACILLGIGYSNG